MPININICSISCCNINICSLSHICSSCVVTVCVVKNGLRLSAFDVQATDRRSPIQVLTEGCAAWLGWLPGTGHLPHNKHGGCIAIVSYKNVCVVTVRENRSWDRDDGCSVFLSLSISSRYLSCCYLPDVSWFADVYYQWEISVVVRGSRLAQQCWRYRWFITRVDERYFENTTKGERRKTVFLLYMDVWHFAQTNCTLNLMFV